MIPQLRIWHLVAAAFLLGAAAGGLGYAFGWFDGLDAGIGRERARLQPVIDALKDEKAEARRQADAERGKHRIVSERLAADLEAAQAALLASREKASHEIQRLTSANRACLSARAVRVLNAPAGPAPGRAAAPGAAAGGADAPAASAGPDPDRPAGPDDGGAASERSVADALLEARAGYEGCRSRLHRLQDWARAVTG